jgi:anaerobic ribonucleoside-triphosphate reductase activating protein
MIKYSNYSIVFREITDKVSLSINITNCQNKCEGCHSAYLRENIGEELTNERLIKLIDDNKGIDCVIFMGHGDDLNRICDLSKIVKSKNILVALYSGNNIVEKEIFQYFDYVKIGQYIRERGGLDNINTNQRMYKISNNNIEDITRQFQKI